MSRTVPGAAPTTKRKSKSAAPVASLSSNKETLHSQAAAGAAAGDKSSGRPDKEAHERQIADYDREIAVLQVQMDALRSKIAGNDPKSSAANEKRTELRKQMNDLRGTQAGHKNSREGTMRDMKALQDKVATKLKTLNDAKGKFPYKSAQDVDNQIKALDKQVESGTLKLVEERKILQEISMLRKSRKTVESFSTQQESIDADRKKIDEIKAALDNPEAKAANDAYNGIKQQLDDLNKEQDSAFENRNKLYAERDDLKKKIDEQWTMKKETRSTYKSANDAYYTKMNEDRARRIEKQKAERAAYEETKRSEVNERLLEEASAPAYEREIEDTRTLIQYFSRGGGKTGANVPTPTLATAADGVPKAGLASLPTLEIRQVESTIPEGAQALKKKGEDEEMMFGGGGKKGKKGKKGPKATEDGEAAPVSSQSLNLPMPTLAALLHLNVPTPLSQVDIPKTIEALEERQKFYKDNQEKTTQDRIAAAKARIAKATAAAPLSGGKKTDETPELSRRASAEAEVVPLSHEEEKTSTNNASVDETVESNVTLDTAETTDDAPEKSVEAQQEETVQA